MPRKKKKEFMGDFFFVCIKFFFYSRLSFFATPQDHKKARFYVAAHIKCTISLLSLKTPHTASFQNKLNTLMTTTHQTHDNGFENFSSSSDASLASRHWDVRNEFFFHISLCTQIVDLLHDVNDALAYSEIRKKKFEDFFY